MSQCILYRPVGLISDIIQDLQDLHAEMEGGEGNGGWEKVKKQG